MSKFQGFDRPKQNWSKLPHVLIDCLADISSQAELKVVLYILRHTWGFSEFGVPKRITLDEFQCGRKQRDGSRIDAGTGLSRNSVRDGIQRAIADGFIVQIPDERDAGRHSHEYQLNMRGSKTDPQVSKTDPLGVKNCPPIRERNLERNNEKEKLLQQEKLDVNFSTALKAYQNTFGPLGSQHLYEKFQMLWDEYPELEVHKYARKEMHRAMMREENHVQPNLGYYAQCLATGAARAQGKREGRRSGAKRRDVRTHEVADINDPAIQAWLEERGKDGASDQS